MPLIVARCKEAMWEHNPLARQARNIADGGRGAYAHGTLFHAFWQPTVSSTLQNIGYLAETRDI